RAGADVAAPAHPDLDADASGGGAGRRRGGGRATAALRAGDPELPGGAVRLLPGGGLAADEQRPGALVRQRPLPRAARQRPQSGFAGSGGAGGGAGGRGLGHALATRRGARPGRGLCAALAASAQPTGETPGGAAPATAVPPRTLDLPDKTGG